MGGDTRKNLEQALLSARAEIEDLKDRWESEQLVLKTFREKVALARYLGQEDVVASTTEQLLFHKGRALLFEASIEAVTHELELIEAEMLRRGSASEDYPPA